MLAHWLYAAAAVAFTVFVYGLNLRARWRMRHLPGPQPTWLFGNLREMGKLGMHNALPQWEKQFGSIYRCFFGRFAIVVISDPELVKEVCIKKFMSFHDRQYNMVNAGGTDQEANCTMHHGILSARGKYWAGLRSAVEPVFHSGQLTAYAPMMNSAAEKLAARLAARKDKEASLNLNGTLGTMTLEVIGTSAFGVDFDTDKEESRVVKEAQFIFSPPKRPNSLNRMGALLVPELGRLWFLLSSWMGSEAVRGSFTARGYLLGTSQVLLRNAQRHLAGEKARQESAAPKQQGLLRDPDMEYYNQAKADAARDYGSSRPGDTSILFHLLRANNKETGKPFSELEIMAQSNTFLLAGYETTSTALMFAIVALSTYPEVQAKMLAEVDAFPWKAGGGIGFDDLKSFPYTRAVIDEAMRMWPPVTPMVGLQREATAATTLGGYSLPRGSKVFINVQSIHHDPRHYPEPEVFRPERFLEGSAEAAARNPYAYLPFGMGPRKCVGYRFALEEAVITLAQLYRRFTFALDDDLHPPGQPLDYSSGITLNVKGGVWVKPIARCCLPTAL